MTHRLHGHREPYLSVREAAEALGVSVRTAQSWCASGRLRVKPKRKAGAPYRVVPSSVRKLKRQREGR